MSELVPMSSREIAQQLPAWDELPVPQQPHVESISLFPYTFIGGLLGFVVDTMLNGMTSPYTWTTLICQLLGAGIGFGVWNYYSIKQHRLPTPPQRLAVQSEVYDGDVLVSACDAHGRTYAQQIFGIHEETEAIEYAIELQAAINTTREAAEQQQLQAQERQEQLDEIVERVNEQLKI